MKRDDVAELIAEGYTDKQIAGLLQLSVKTVEYHIARICLDWEIDRSRNIRVQITRRILNAA